MRASQILVSAMLVGGGVGYGLSALPPAVSQSPQQREQVESSVYYSGCNAVRAAGKTPLYAGQPGYRTGMDGDLDGIACEPYPVV